MRVLITGSLGFLGINLVRYLAEADPGAEIVGAYSTAPDDLALRFLAPVAGRLRLVPLDVTDRPRVVDLVQQQAVTHIVHAAAITPSLDRERAEPTHIVDVNLGGIVNALEAAVAVPTVQRLILISSSGVYGAPTGDPLQPQSEEGPLQLTGLYAIAKYSGELLGRRYAELTGKQITAARLPALYGPMERPTRSRQNMSLPQRLLQPMLEGRRLRLYGPEHTSDWTHVQDACEGIRALLVAPRWRYPVYNISCGQTRTFRDLVAAFAAHGLQAEWVDDPAAADISMTPDRVRAPMDITRLRADTGFAPRFTLEAGVADLVSSSR